jgi:two-component system sensor histidine kinase LytS
MMRCSVDHQEAGMDFTILLKLLQNISEVALFSLLIGQIRYFRNLVYGKQDWKRVVILSTFFGVMSVIGTDNGVRINDAFANTRIVGAVVGGLVGGPIVGAIAGMAGGLHRYYTGGFTATACAVSTVVCGLLGGALGARHNILRIHWRHIFLLGLGSELIQKVLVLIIAKPFDAALQLELKIALPTTIVTILGILIFTRIFISIKMMQDESGAFAANQALDIASRTLPHLRTGLNETSAEKTAEIIHEMAIVDAVVITDCEKILSVKGCGIKGESLCTAVTEAVLKQNNIKVLCKDKDLCFPFASPLKSAIAAPFFHENKPIGTLQFYYTHSLGVTQTDIKLVDGLAKLLSVQIELAEIENLNKMRHQAELSALQAQINPHFLFNTLSTIMSYCRSDPELARNLLGKLSDIFRRNLKNKGNFNSLKEELDGIKSYLEIESVRFADRLKVLLNIEESVLNVKLPILTLQPIIENAIHHGLFPKIKDCKLTISALPDRNHLQISIVDNGAGIDQAKLAEILNHKSAGIGLSNVHKRLQSIYGKEYGLKIKSLPGSGTNVTINIPLEKDVS